MNILYYPQFSMRDYKTGLFNVLSDAQFTKCKGMLYGLLSRNTDLCIHLVLPFPMKISKNVERENIVSEHFVDVFGDAMRTFFRQGRLRFIMNDYLFGKNAMSSRFNFPLHTWINIITNCSPDIILNEVPELTPNFRAALNFTDDYVGNVLIVSMFEHYENRYHSAQAIGMRKSDISVFPSNKIYNDVYKSRQIVDPHTKKLVWEYFFSSTELKTARISKKENSLVFASRFSDDEKNKPFLFSELALGIKHLFDKIYILNPNQALTKDHAKSLFGNDSKFVIAYSPLDREEYLSIIGRARYGIIMYDVNRFYSVGVAEMLSSGMHVFYPYSEASYFNTTSLYADYIKGKKNSFPAIAEMTRIIKGEVENYDEASFNETSRESIKLMENFSGEFVSRTIIKDLTEALNVR